MQQGLIYLIINGISTVKTYRLSLIPINSMQVPVQVLELLVADPPIPTSKKRVGLSSFIRSAVCFTVTIAALSEGARRAPTGVS